MQSQSLPPNGVTGDKALRSAACRHCNVSRQSISFSAQWASGQKAENREPLARPNAFPDERDDTKLRSEFTDPEYTTLAPSILRELPKPIANYGGLQLRAPC